MTWTNISRISWGFISCQDAGATSSWKLFYEKTARSGGGSSLKPHEVVNMVGLQSWAWCLWCVQVDTSLVTNNDCYFLKKKKTPSSQPWPLGLLTGEPHFMNHSLLEMRSICREVRSSPGDILKWHLIHSQSCTTINTTLFQTFFISLKGNPALFSHAHAHPPAPGTHYCAPVSMDLSILDI